MGPLSVSAHRGLVHWQGLLLAVSFLNFWCLPTTVQPAVFVTKNAVEGEDVNIRLHNKPPSTIVVTWYRERVENKRIIAFLSTRNGMHIRGPPDGPVTIKYDGSLLLRNVTKKDAGTYIVILTQQNSKQLKGVGRLYVHQPEKMPTLVASNTTVTENKDAVTFTCHTNAVSVKWLFNGTDLQPTERMVLSERNRSLTIERVQRKDAGEYQCKASNPVSSAESETLELDVEFE